jgi:DNA-binding LytR/AlgR family response regulator
VARAKERLGRRPADYGQTLVTSATVAERARGFRTRFVVRRGNTHHIVPADQVDWLDVADNYLSLHVGPKTHLWRGTMKQAEDELDPERFVRIHRSVIVAVDRHPHRAVARLRGHVDRAQGRRTAPEQRQYADRVRPCCGSKPPGGLAESR